MRVISRRKLREFWSKHGDAQTSLLLCYQRTTDAQWQNLADVRQVFPSADLVGNLTVFNKLRRIYITLINSPLFLIFLLQSIVKPPSFKSRSTTFSNSSLF